MSNPSTDRVRGELLREWRVSQQCDVTVLASSANLSVAQIRQLESGGVSLFYTPAIKENAARKVASLLGGDPAAVIHPIDDASVAQGPSVVEALAELSRQRAQAARPASVFSQAPRGLLGVLLTLGSFAAGLALLQHPVSSGGVRSLWHTPTASLAPALQPDTAPAVAVLAEPASASEPSSVSESAPSPVALDQGATDNSLCQANKAPAVLTPASPSKAGDMVYLVAQKPGAICVVDGAGRSTVLALQSNEARSVYGPAPWRVHFEQPEQAQLYFQGVRLRLPDAGITTVALQEGLRSR
ncbi:hypothetical protein ACHEXL_07490 [Limnohabitans sp. yimb22184]|jgi:cytoskeleton protein RodZ|uniref:hypothetical protein n=1 Tax=Limnohabitans sp. YIMB22184 TaxID=3374104 RepID=UPI003A8550E3